MACTALSQLLSCTIDTPIGLLTISSCGNGLHSLKLPEIGAGAGGTENTPQNFIPNLSATLSSTPIRMIKGADSTVQAQEHLQDGLKWIQTYFQSPATLESIKYPKFCNLNGTEFEEKVWTTLRDTVHFGEHVSYSELAAKIQNPKASRAVGTALKNNHLLLFVPCHRVIRADGNLGKFSGGKWDGIKKFLIEHESKCTKK